MSKPCVALSRAITARSLVDYEIIGALFDRMAPVLWVIAVLGNLTVINRMIFTYHETKHLEEAQLRTRSVAASKI